MSTVGKILFLLFLSSCAADTKAILDSTVRDGDPTDEVQALLTIAPKDLETAIRLAERFNDPAGATCYRVLQSKVVDISDFVSVEPPGVFTAYEKARIIRRRLSAGFSEEVNVACAALVNDAKSTILGVVKIVKGVVL